MKLASVLPVLLTISALQPDVLAAQSLGIFQSSLDGRPYEIRTRGEMGLDIYTDSGQLVAVLDRKKENEQFKGKTQVLASRCPQNSGKIETVATSEDRIRMRVETPSKNLNNQMACNMLLLSQWQPFDLIRQPSASSRSSSVTAPPTPATAAASTPPPTGVALDASFSEVAFHLTEATATGKTLLVTISVSNSGTDRPLSVGDRGNGWGCHVRGNGPGAEIIEENGLAYGVAAVTVGNQPSQSDLVSGVATKILLRFDNLATIGGVAQASEIKRLMVGVQVGAGAGGGAPCGILEFRNVPIQKK